MNTLGTQIRNKIEQDKYLFSLLKWISEYIGWCSGLSATESDKKILL